MMVLKFILKNLIIVFAIAFAINMLLKANMEKIANVVTPQTLQLESIASEDLLDKREMLE